MRTREIEPSPVVLITSPDPYKLQALVRREVYRKAMIVQVPVRRVAVGLWAAEVIQLRPLERRWVKPVAAVAGVVGVLGGAVAAGWWLLGVLVDAVAGAAGVVGIAAVGIALVVGLVLAGSRRAGCETTVIVRHRH